MPFGSNPLAAIKSALSGGQRMAVGGGSPMPRFGPRVAAKGTPAPSAMSVGGGAPKGVGDMLSRPKRTRSSGYSKTANIKGGASPANMPPGGSGGSAGPGVGGGF